MCTLQTIFSVTLSGSMAVSQAGDLLTPTLPSGLNGPTANVSAEEAWLNQMPPATPNNAGVAVNNLSRQPSFRLQPMTQSLAGTAFGLQLNLGAHLGSQIVCINNNRDAANGIGIGWSNRGGLRLTLQGRGLYQFAQLAHTRQMRDSCKSGDSPQVCRALMVTRCN